MHPYAYQLSRLPWLWAIKEGSKPPYIGDVNDNSGAYQELFSLAAEKIGHQLKIIRLPKKRIYLQLAAGQIDFYPSSGFSPERSEYLYWLSNGFVTKSALLSTHTDQEITDINTAKGKLLVPLGSSAANYVKENPNIEAQKMGILPIDTAILALRLGRGNFYIYDIDTLDYYLKRKKLRSFEELSLRLHPNAIEKEFSSLYSAFSIHSDYFTPEANPDYDKGKESGYNNQRIRPSKDCLAHAFEQALKELQQAGITDRIYNKYFK